MSVIFAILMGLGVIGPSVGLGWNSEPSALVLTKLKSETKVRNSFISKYGIIHRYAANKNIKSGIFDYTNINNVASLYDSRWSSWQKWTVDAE